MTTPYRRALVSLAVTMTLLGLGACARTSLPPVALGSSPMEAHPLTIRFDNDARKHVHVYLIDERRQWLLGRVEPGSTVMLRVPAEALADSPSAVRLAVLTGEPVTLQAARHPRAALTMSLPSWQLMSRRWSFAQGGVTSLGR
jgi:hypothetical protein